MGIIDITPLMNLLNRKLKKVISFNKKFDVFLQNGGVGCYSIKKWAVFIPNSFDNYMKIYGILHEGAHLILREKLSELISPEKFDTLKWSMEPFFIDNSIFALDEAFAEAVTNTVIADLPKDIFKKKIIFDKVSEPSYEGSEESLHIFLAKISDWKIPITLKNNNLAISNTLNNLTFLRPKERINAILEVLSNINNYDYKNFINKVIKNPLENSPTIKLFSRICNTKIKIDQRFKKFDHQIFLDYLETLSWVGYTENYHVYNDFIKRKNLNKPKKVFPKLTENLRKELLGVSKNLKRIRKKIIKSWVTKDTNNMKKLIKNYNYQRWKYRKKIDLKNNFNKYGFGEFKWE